MTLPDADDLRLLTDAVARFADRNAPEAGMPTPAADIWPDLCEMGLVGLTLPTETGGGGMGPLGAVAAGLQLGARAVPVSFPLAGVLVPALLAAAGRDDLVAAVMTGETRVAVASALLPAAGNSGHDSLAFGPQRPDLVLCAGSDGAELRLCAASDVVSATAMMADGQPAFRLVPTGAAGESLSVSADGREAALSPALLAAAAETTGAMESLFEATLAYVKLRKQFGKALGSFQTIQFRMVDLSIALEEARALLNAAAQALATGEPDGPALCRAAWVQSLWSGRKLAEEAIQLHGAIGMTAECAISHLVRRVMINEALFGPAEAHMAAYRRLAA